MARVGGKNIPGRSKSIWANVLRWGKVGRVKALKGAAQLGC